MTGWWTPDRKAYALNYLLNAGLSPYGAAGLVSRWANVESIAAGPGAINPNGGAFGIAQWLGARKAGIYPNTNFDAQLAYAVRELQAPESYDTGRGYQLLLMAQDADTAARGATMFERAEHYNSATGRDDWTAKTAAGIPAILALAGNAGQTAQQAQSELRQNFTKDQADAGNADMALILVGVGVAGLLVLWLVSD